MKKIEINTLVTFDEKSCSEEDYEAFYKNEFPKGKIFVFMGEIKQAPGHCILADLETGKIEGMYHTENFREATDDEI